MPEHQVLDGRVAGLRNEPLPGIKDLFLFSTEWKSNYQTFSYRIALGGNVTLTWRMLKAHVSSIYIMCVLHL